MTIDEFEQQLKKASLSKKQFASLVNMNYNSVVNWNTSSTVPNWVASWLNLYLENKAFSDIKTVIKSSGLCQK